MISVTIKGKTRRLGEVDPHWVNQQVDGRGDGQRACVQVAINEPAAKMTFATPGCMANGGDGRPPNAVEQALFDQCRKQMSTSSLRPLLRTGWQPCAACRTGCRTLSVSLALPVYAH